MANHILIGIGGTGYKVLRDFRKRLWTEVPDIKKRRELPVRFLYVDSDESATPDKLAGNDDLQVNGQDTAITADEYLGIKNIDLNAIFNNLSSYPNLQPIIENGAFIKNSIGEVGAAAGQKRRAGRILFAANAHNFNNKLTHLIGELQRETGSANDLNIYIFAGLAGGTGSGSIVDAVSQVLVHHPQANLEVYAMLPEQLPPSGADAGRYHANGYAALMELSALNAGTYLPADVSTGAPHITLPRPGDNKQFGLTVYTNVNRNGATVDSYKTLPALLADVMYFRIFNPFNEAMRDLNRGFKSENRPDFLVEYKTNTKPGKPVERARTKAVGSFGIKRLRYPDDKLTAHASDTIARNILSMMLFMNYDNDLGFLNEPSRQGKDYGEYINKANLKNWKLSDADLSLSVPILPPADKKSVSTFADFWEKEVALDYDYQSAKSMGHPLQILEQYFDERWKGEFREEKGVEAYFQGKSHDQVIGDSAEAIMAKIQDALFNNWLHGQYSTYDLKQITERILEMLQNKYNGLNQEIVELEKDIEDKISYRRELEDGYNGVGLLKNLLKKSKENIFVEYAHTLSEEYTDRTKLVSINLFQRTLLPKLIQQFTDLQTEIQKFAGRMEDSVGEYGTLVGQNTPAERPDLRLNLVEVGDINVLSDFEKILLHDRPKMEAMAQKYRDFLAADSLGLFSNVTKKLNNISKLERVSKEVLDELINAYHAEVMRKKPVLGLNVLEQLYQMYGNNENEIGRFATSLVQNSEVFLTLNDQEVNKVMRNTISPTEVAAAGPNTIMLVAIPNIETDDEDLRRFVDTFKIKLRQAFNASETRSFVLYESPLPNEITIISYQNIFPLRTIDYMPFLRQKFEQLVKSNNESNNTANKILLFSEGDGSALPPLEGEGEGPKGDELISYLFLAAALGILKQGEDDFGNKGWGKITTDFFGAETFSMLSPSFTGIIISPQFTPELTEEIVEKVDEEKGKQRHVQEKAQMAQIIKDVMKDHVLKEAGSPNSEVYRLYASKAMDAINALQ